MTFMGQQSNSINNGRKKGNSDVTLFQHKLQFFFFFDSVIVSSIEYLQDTWLTKLLGQFIELHSTQFFKRLKI